MYYPVQIPYILNRAFSRNIKYNEMPVSDFNGFVICFWDMQPVSEQKQSIENVIAADACIDLVAGYDERSIGFAGMSRTDFHFTVELPKRYIGVRLMPGAFSQLTGFPASAAMDTFLPIEDVFVDFSKSDFFDVSFEHASEYLRQFLADKTESKTPDRFASLFHLLSDNAPANTTELYQLLHFSPRQCQRLFLKHYGITPKMALSIARFQKCLEILTSPKASTVDILNATTYYDQPHFINDFKRNIGLTPMELIRFYQQ